VLQPSWWSVCTALVMSLKCFTVFWDVVPCSLVDANRRFRDACYHISADGAVSTFEKLISFYETTRHNISQERYHTRRRENLKSYKCSLSLLEPSLESVELMRLLI
jgi:hypothetical protein